MRIDACKEMLANQFGAALATLNACIDRCPEAGWNAPVGNLAFCQVAFHTLFFTDLYLGKNMEGLRRQQFHRVHQEFFRDYEELEDRKQKLLYDRPAIKKYLEHCRKKARKVIADETERSLAAPCGFRKNVSRAEFYIYSIRHIQHHSAQLSLRLRIDHGVEIPWVGSGWRKV